MCVSHVSKRGFFGFFLSTDTANSPPAETEGDVTHAVRIGRRDVSSARLIEEALWAEVVKVGEDLRIVIHAPGSTKRKDP